MITDYCLFLCVTTQLQTAASVHLATTQLMTGHHTHGSSAGWRASAGYDQTAMAGYQPLTVASSDQPFSTNYRHQPAPIVIKFINHCQTLQAINYQSSSTMSHFHWATTNQPLPTIMDNCNPFLSSIDHWILTTVKHHQPHLAFGHSW